MRTRRRSVQRNMIWLTQAFSGNLGNIANGSIWPIAVTKFDEVQWDSTLLRQYVNLWIEDTSARWQGVLASVIWPDGPSFNTFEQSTHLPDPFDSTDSDDFPLFAVFGNTVSASEYVPAGFGDAFVSQAESKAKRRIPRNHSLIHYIRFHNVNGAADTNVSGAVRTLIALKQ